MSVAQFAAPRNSLAAPWSVKFVLQLHRSMPHARFSELWSLIFGSLEGPWVALEHTYLRLLTPLFRHAHVSLLIALIRALRFPARANGAPGWPCKNLEKGVSELLKSSDVNERLDDATQMDDGEVKGLVARLRACGQIDDELAPPGSAGAAASSSNPLVDGQAKAGSQGGVEAELDLSGDAKPATISSRKRNQLKRKLQEQQEQTKYDEMVAKCQRLARENAALNAQGLQAGRSAAPSLAAGIDAGPEVLTAADRVSASTAAAAPMLWSVGAAPLPLGMQGALSRVGLGCLAEHSRDTWASPLPPPSPGQHVCLWKQNFVSLASVLQEETEAAVLERLRRSSQCPYLPRVFGAARMLSSLRYEGNRFTADLVYAQEYVRGISLDRMMASNEVCEAVEGGLTGNALVVSRARIALQVVRAVQHLHRCGIVHRDIKPANVILSSAALLALHKTDLAAVNPQADLPWIHLPTGLGRTEQAEQNYAALCVDGHAPVSSPVPRVARVCVDDDVGLLRATLIDFNLSLVLDGPPELSDYTPWQWNGGTTAYSAIEWFKESDDPSQVAIPESAPSADAAAPAAAVAAASAEPASASSTPWLLCDQFSLGLLMLDILRMYQTPLSPALWAHSRRWLASNPSSSVADYFFALPAPDPDDLETTHACGWHNLFLSNNRRATDWCDQFGLTRILSQMTQKRCAANRSPPIADLQAALQQVVQRSTAELQTTEGEPSQNNSN